MQNPLEADLEALFQEAPQSPAEKDVRDWLKLNRDTFTSEWSSLEVAHLAITVGFEPMAVYAVLSHWKDALAGSRVENRAAVQAYAMASAMSEFAELEAKLNYVPEADLTFQWKAYLAYSLEGIEFEEVA